MGKMSECPHTRGKALAYLSLHGRARALNWKASLVGMAKRGVDDQVSCIMPIHMPINHACYSPVLQLFRQLYAAPFTSNTDTMGSLFAQQDHMQNFRFVVIYLEFYLISFSL